MRLLTILTQSGACLGAVLCTNGFIVSSGQSPAISPELPQRVPRIMPDCSPAQAALVSKALEGCATLASQAALYAISGPAEQFARYFMTTDPVVRELVAFRFASVAKECMGTTALTKNFCTDTGKNICQPKWIAVTIGKQIVRCSKYWDLPLLSDKCHGQDQVTKIIHEMTHVEGLHDPQTVDFPDNYGWPGVSRLTADQAIQNADNYAFYANAVWVGNGC